MKSKRGKRIEGDKPKKIYRLAFIFANSVVDASELCSADYHEIYRQAIIEMRGNNAIVSMLIFSNHGTALVLKRKFADNTIQRYDTGTTKE